MPFSRTWNTNPEGPLQSSEPAVWTPGPPEVVPHLCGATLFACRKKSGGVRPIAVGEVLHRLISKCLTHAVQDEAISTLTPLQLGV